MLVCCWPNTPLLLESFLRSPNRISFSQAVKSETFIDIGPLAWMRNVEQ